MIRAGTSVTFTVTGSVREGWLSFGQSQADLRHGVAANISPLRITDLRIESDDSWRTETWTYRALIVIESPFDHAVESDLASIVWHAFHEATSSDPIVTSGEWTQNAPRKQGGQGVPWTMIAIVVVGALVLVIWARP